MLPFLTKKFGEISPRYIINVGFALFLVIILGSVLAVYILRLGALRDAKKESVYLSSLLAEHAHLAFESADHVLANIANDLGRSQTHVQIEKTPELYNYLKNNLHGSRHLRYLTVNDDKGQLAAYTVAYPAPDRYSGD